MRFRDVSRDCRLAVVRLERDCFFLLWGAFIVRLWLPGVPGVCSYLFLIGGSLLVPVGFVVWLRMAGKVPQEIDLVVWYWPSLTAIVLLIVEGFVMVLREAWGLGVLPTGIGLGGCLIFQGRAVVFLVKRMQIQHAGV